jgi:DNA-directed RNA polymerase subunit RPC12/RpoP
VLGVLAITICVKMEYGWVVPTAVVAACVLVYFGLGVMPQAYAYLARGRRNRERGIPCSECHKTAFPVEGTTTHYRCSNCGSQFEGPEHF